MPNQPLITLRRLMVRGQKNLDYHGETLLRQARIMALRQTGEFKCRYTEVLLLFWMGYKRAQDMLVTESEQQSRAFRPSPLGSTGMVL